MTKEEKILARFVEKQPLALALPRAAECLALNGFKLKIPILDFGCGDGVFSLLCFGKRKIDVGLDQNPREIELAKHYQAYRKTTVATGKAIPYSGSYFQTVIANSVLEHINGDLQPTLKEINRVLKKRGILLFTVPRPVISGYLFYPKILCFFRLSGLARSYIDLKQNLWKHHHLLEKEGWQNELQRAGFKIQNSFTLIPPKTVAFHDIFYIFGIPYVLNKKLFKSSAIFRPGWLGKLLAKLLISYCRVYDKEGGTTLCIEAVKV